MLKRVEELTDKRGELRETVERFMEEFRKETKEIEGFSAVVFQESENGYDYDFSIRTGLEDIYADNSEYCEDKWKDYDSSKCFWESMPIDDLLTVCGNLDKALIKIQEDIGEECEAIDSFLSKLKKVMP